MQGVLLGLEEEVFLTQPQAPSLQSLYYLARLIWTDPRFYFVHTDSNFARGEDVLQGVMGGVEVSTSPCSSPGELVADLAARRRALAACYRELADIYPVDEELFAVPPAETIVALVGRHGITGAYSALDSAYRGGPLAPDREPRCRVRPDRVLAGLLGYYLPHLPYKARKAWQEW